MKRKLYMAAAAWLALGANGAHAAAQAAAERCVSAQEAEAIITALMPKVLAAVQTTCSKALPADAYLRTEGGALVERYAVPGKAAEPAALAALGRITGTKDVTPEAFTMMAPMIALGVAGDIKPEECGDIDRFAALLAPLPPANLSALLVAVLEKAEKENKSLDIRICKPAARVKR